jgi:hypothetical protein
LNKGFESRPAARKIGSNLVGGKSKTPSLSVFLRCGNLLNPVDLWRAFVRDIRTFSSDDSAEARALLQNIHAVMSDSEKIEHTT